MNVSIVPLDVKQIRIHMIEQEMSMRDLSALTGMTESNLYAMLRRGSVRSTSAGRIAKALGIESRDIISKEAIA